MPGGFGRIAFAVEGPLLLIANDSDLLQSTIDRPMTPPASFTSNYAASYRHERERGNYGRLMRSLDFQQAQPGNQPAFFSGNIASFSTALRRINAIELTERTTADRVEQQVVYTFLSLSHYVA